MQPLQCDAAHLCASALSTSVGTSLSGTHLPRPVPASSRNTSATSSTTQPSGASPCMRSIICVSTASTIWGLACVCLRNTLALQRRRGPHDSAATPLVHQACARHGGAPGRHGRRDACLDVLRQLARLLEARERLQRGGKVVAGGRKGVLVHEHRLADVSALNKVDVVVALVRLDERWHLVHADGVRLDGIADRDGQGAHARGVHVHAQLRLCPILRGTSEVQLARATCSVASWRQ